MPGSKLNVEFRLKHALQGHSRAVNTMAIDKKMELLISGGDDGILFIWNLQSGEQVQLIQTAFNGSISAVCWVTAMNSNTKQFVFGCADGSLHLYEEIKPGFFDFRMEVKDHRHAIEDISYDQYHRRVAAVGGGDLRLWALTPDCALQSLEINLATRNHTIARCVQFLDRGTKILVFFLGNHEIVLYDLSNQSVLWSKSIPTRIGFARLVASDSVAISNLVNCVDIYRLPTLHKLSSYEQQIVNNYTVQIGSVLDGSVLVSGSTNGVVSITDTEDKSTVQLQHSVAGGRVQCVAVECYDGDICVASASTDEGPSVIKIWSKKLAAPERQGFRIFSSGAFIWQIIVTVISLVAMLLTLFSNLNMSLLDIVPNLATHGAAE